MNTFKSAEVVSLPTKGRSTIYIDSNGKLQIGFNIIRTEPDISQHLCFITDEEIKVGDIILEDLTLFHYDKCIFEVTIDDLDRCIENYKNGYCKKVVALTNQALNLPTPSQSFVKKYCEQGGIDEVMIEFEEICSDTTCNCSNRNECGNFKQFKINKIKVDKNNEITIKAIKDSFSKDELKSAYINGFGTALFQEKAVLKTKGEHFEEWFYNNF